LNARLQSKRGTAAPTSDFEIKPFNPDGDFVTISVSNIYTPLNLNTDSKDDDKKVKGKRGPKKSESTKSSSVPKRGTKRARAKDMDDDEFTCSYEESSHSTSSGSEKLTFKVKQAKRAKFSNPSSAEPIAFTDVMTYESMDGTDSMTTTPLRRDSCSEDTLGEILASTCGTPIDDSSAWSQLDCNTANFANPMGEDTFSTTPSAASSETNQVNLDLVTSGGHGEQFYFGESTVVSFIDDTFDSNLFSY
jgi:hypothetical protein